VSRYRFIEGHRTVWRVEEMCRVLSVSRSGFYAWKKRPESQQALTRRRLDRAIEKTYRASKGRSGSPKVTHALQAQGWRVGENRVARRMCALGLRSIIRRRFRVTTHSNHVFAVAPNRLQRKFTVAHPNQVWVSDITYIRTQSGWIYLVIFLDLYSRKVVGWSLNRTLHHAGVLRAMEQACHRRQPGKGLMIHSDRGVQYACTSFTQAIQGHRFIQSMSRKGNCWDNAVAESFFHLLKTELVYHTTWRGYRDAYRDLFEYIEVFYNRERMHATLGYLSPAQFEAQTRKSAA
jgi:putative transposase